MTDAIGLSVWMSRGGRRRARCVLSTLGLALALCAAPLQACGSARVADPALAHVDELPRYAPTEVVSGSIRLWGHGSFKRDFMGNLVKAWITEFQRSQPAVTFAYQMYGTASAVGALYTGAGDIAILGEEISPDATRAFIRAKGYPPTSFTVATGSLDVNFYDYAHMIFVHRDNPITQLSLRQLDAIFGAEHRRGNSTIRHWGDLGLEDIWAEQAIQPYGWKTDVDFALFFRERVLENSHRWNPTIRQFEHVKRADGSQYDHGQQIVDALANDRYGIAISNTRYANPNVKMLALAWRDDGPWLMPSTASLIDQSYPLVRLIPALVDQPPGQPLRPAVREFLRFLLSRQGQSILLAESGYLPVGKAQLADERERLQ